MICSDCDQYKITNKRGSIMIIESCNLGQEWSSEKGMQGCTLRKSTIEKLKQEAKNGKEDIKR